MRYYLLLLCAALLLTTAFACGGDDESPAAPATPAAAANPDDFQATIDAALARIAATRAFSAAASQLPAATATPAPTMGRPTVDAAGRPSPTPPAATPAPSVDSSQSVYDLAEIRNWEYAGQNAASAVARIRSIGWIVDGLQTVDEFNAAERLVNIAIDAPDTLDILLDNHTLSEGLTPLDLPALLSLQRLAQNRPERLAPLTAAGWFRDGLTPEEAAIVAVLYDRSRFESPEFDDIVSDPESLAVTMGETRNGAGESVPIAVIRSGAVPAGSPVMATARMAVPIYEEMFAAPLPTPAIVFHITDYVAGTAAGTNYQTHITLKPEIDRNEQPDFGRHTVFHEIAHYYLYAEPEWYAEGGAEFAASYARKAAQGAPIAATNSPCAAAASLSEVERRTPDDRREAQSDADLWRCNYSLGERLLLSLYRELGEERFLQGWRALYAEPRREPSYPAQRDFSETDLRVAWLRAGGMAGQPALEHIWDQWYRGSADRAIVAPPDTGPVDTALPAINGRVDDAYIALQQLGGPVSSFSAGEAAGWIYLTLEYSYALSGGPQELELAVVEYYQDGFTYRRRNQTVTLKPEHIGGTQWVSVGPTPPHRWAPGQYWVSVHADGRKIAEVGFEVTP